MPIVDPPLSSSSSGGDFTPNMRSQHEQLDDDQSSSSSSNNPYTHEPKGPVLSGPSSIYHPVTKGIGAGGSMMGYPNTWRKTPNIATGAPSTTITTGSTGVGPHRRYTSSYSVIVGKNHSPNPIQQGVGSMNASTTNPTHVNTSAPTTVGPSAGTSMTTTGAYHTSYPSNPQQPHRQIKLRHKQSNNSTVKNGNNGPQKEKKKKPKSQSNRYKHAQHSNTYQVSTSTSSSSQSNHRKSISPRSSEIYIHSNEQDQTLTKQLHSTLCTRGVYEDQDGMQRRLRVLRELHQLLLGWSDLLLRQSININASDKEDDMTSDVTSITTNQYKLQLISFGSYRLGVNNPSADLDLLALCPPHVARSDFFSSLVSMLNEDERVREVHPVPKAYTPVIKFEMKGISIDLLFVSLLDGTKLGLIDSLGIGEGDMSTVQMSISEESRDQTLSSNTPMNYSEALLPAASRSTSPSSSTVTTPLPPRIEFNLDDTMLISLDEQSVRSLNGVRVAQYLCTLIPNKANFTIVLRTVKEWALVHGLYSNVLGFLGGINWAILVAWVCKRHVKASPPLLLKLFFQTFRKWAWPKPVKLNKIVMQPPQGVMPLPIWNPKANPRDRAHLMPIITPVYPSMNSSYNVGEPQLRRIQEELYRGEQTILQIANGSAQWSDLLERNDFFREHAHYLQINIIASNNDDYRAWFGLCESKLRILIAGLESPENGIQAYPFAKFFKRTSNRDKVVPSPETLDDMSNASGDEDPTSSEPVITAAFFIALRFANGIDSVDLKNCTEEFVYKVNTWEERKHDMDLSIMHVLQSELPSFVFDKNEDTAPSMSEEVCDERRETDSTEEVSEGEDMEPMSPMKKTRR